MHLINEIPSSHTSGLSPYEKLYGHPHDYSLLVFSCTCSSVERNKLSSHFAICVFLGYGEIKRIIVVMIMLLKSYIFLIMSFSFSIFISSLFIPSVIPSQRLILSALTILLMILLTYAPY